MSDCGCTMQLFLPLLKLFVSIIHVLCGGGGGGGGVVASCQTGTK